MAERSGAADLHPISTRGWWGGRPHGESLDSRLNRPHRKGLHTSPQLLFNALVIILLIGYIGYRQTQWRAFEPGRIWRGPIILAVVGLGYLAYTTTAIGTLDIAVLVLELAISVGIGALMGAIATFRPLTAEDRVRDPRAQWASRTGAVGIVLWVAMIAVRIGIDVLAGMAGSHLATSTGVILLVFAANRAGRAITMGARLQKLTRVSA
ncbi:hypothetical protein [Microbacterium sp. ZW T5_56]|uniref:hypothetical protein n=1 Tax=Microbacterium sp. ZW T5_56 TaxID=3378081 RepID=UPI003854A3CE